MNSFDLISIKIKNEHVQARPIEWDREPADGKGNGADGEPITPVKFMTTCPYCAQLINFRCDELYDGDNLKCPACSAHTPPSKVESMTIEMEMAQAPDIKFSVVESPFIDPVANKLIDTDNYL